MTKRPEPCNAARFEEMPRNFFGSHRGEGTPDPIPNSEVKLSIADDTA